jgi:hypothetical protein
VRIVDMKSKNGTQVNGVPVVEAPLKDGDRILLGKFQITFAKALEGKIVLDEAKPLAEEAGTIIRSVGDISKMLAIEGSKTTTAETKKADAGEIEKSNRILRVLTKVAETLIAVRPVEEVLHQVMDIVFDHINADRGFLMLTDEHDPSKLIPMVIQHRKQGTDQGKITISKTIADKCIKERVDLLRRDGRPALRRGTRSASTASGRDVRAALEQGRGDRHHPRRLADAHQLLHGERPSTDRARQLRGRRRRARGSTRRSWRRRRSLRLGASCRRRSRAGSWRLRPARARPSRVREVTILFADISGSPPCPRR